MSTIYSWHYYLTKDGWHETTSKRSSDEPDLPKGTLVAVTLICKESDWSTAEHNYGRIIFRSDNAKAIKKALQTFGIPQTFSDHRINADEVQTYEVGKVVDRPLRFKKSSS